MYILYREQLSSKYPFRVLGELEEVLVDHPRIKDEDIDVDRSRC